VLKTEFGFYRRYYKFRSLIFSSAPISGADPSDCHQLGVSESFDGDKGDDGNSGGGDSDEHHHGRQAGRAEDQTNRQAGRLALALSGAERC
jgi:hypothetical protein